MHIILFREFQRMLCTNFGWNWVGGSGEEVNYANSLQTYRQTDGQAMKTGGQKYCLELSADVI